MTTRPSWREWASEQHQLTVILQIESDLLTAATGFAGVFFALSSSEESSDDEAAFLAAGVAGFCNEFRVRRHNIAYIEHSVIIRP